MTTFVNRYFDKIFVINLPQNVIRWRMISQMLSRYGIDFERVEGVNGFDAKNSQDWKNYASLGLTHPWEQKSGRKRIGSPGAWGASLSHKRVITKAKQEGLKRILILEDDLMIHKDFLNLFPQVVAELPEDWKLFYLSCVQVNWEVTKPYSEYLYHPDVRTERTEQWAALGSFAYALDASVFDLVLDLIETAEWGPDLGPLNDLMLRFPQQTFAAKPHLFATDCYKSTIRNARPSQQVEAWVRASRWEMDCYEPYIDPQPLRVVALLAVRNEERYLSRCLQHLYNQGIETCLIDNGSTDRTLEIAESFRDRGVFRIEHFPFYGVYEWEKILRYKEQLATEIEADWFIHYDADEIREAPKPYINLVEGIEDADRQGFNAINFDEFVFLPSSDEENFEGKDYVAEMNHYYFFQPTRLHRVNAWKKTSKIDLHTSGGHQVEFANIKIFSTKFILRHYIVLSKDHAIEKYGDRVFSLDEVAKGWHGARAKFSAERLKFPGRERLKTIYYFAQWDWDTSEPWKTHEFLEGEAHPPQEQTKHPTIPVQQQVTTNPKAVNGAPMPIIVGVSRSGTTLLRLMLDAHPELAIPSETHFIKFLFELDTQTDSLRERFYQIVTGWRRWPEFQISSDDLSQQLTQMNPFTLGEGLRCFYQLYAARFNKSRWGDKTPGYLLQMKNIEAILPEAHFIHIIRDGRDVALSLRNLWWGPGNDIAAQAKHWVDCITEGRKQGQLCQHYMEVYYEELVAHPTRVLKKICEFIKLPYHPAMEEYYQSATSRLSEITDKYEGDGSIYVTAEQEKALFKETHQPPNPSKIGGWRRQMSKDEQVKYEAIAGYLLRDLGYNLPTTQVKLKLSRPELLEYGPGFIGSTGGSGTRVLARIFKRGGMFLGETSCKSEDTLIFPGYSSRWINTYTSSRMAGVAMPNQLQEQMLRELETILTKHLETFQPSQEQPFWGWKEPRSIFLLPLFHNIFPKMKFLHIVRDGRDMAYSSNQNQLVIHGCTLLDTSEFLWSQPIQSIALWSRLNLLTAEYGEKNMPGQYLRIRFEDLCAAPVTAIQQIFEFFGLSGNVQKIAAEEVSPPATIGRWRSQDAQTLATLHQVGKTALQKFGYLAPEEANELNLEAGVISRLAVEEGSRSRLPEIQADLARSHSRLSQIKAFLE